MAKTFIQVNPSVTYPPRGPGTADIVAIKANLGNSSIGLTGTNMMEPQDERAILVARRPPFNIPNLALWLELDIPSMRIRKLDRLSGTWDFCAFRIQELVDPRKFLVLMSVLTCRWSCS